MRVLFLAASHFELSSKQSCSVNFAYKNTSGSNFSSQIMYPERSAVYNLIRFVNTRRQLTLDTEITTPANNVESDIKKNFRSINGVRVR